MTNHEEQNALRLDAELRGNTADVTAEDKPLFSVAQALRKDGVTESHMDTEVMARQKEHLSLMAKNIKAQKSASTTAQQPVSGPSSPKRPWYVWAGAFATVMAVALIVFVTQSSPTPWKDAARNKASELGQATLSLIVPEAYAADAFTVLAESKTAGGAAVDTTFRVISKVPVDVSALRQSLRIVAADGSGVTDADVPYEVQNDGEQSFRVKPTKQLAAGTVYRVTIATGLQDASGTVRQRDFSWAIQTQDVFRVLRSVPGADTTGVPVDTAISFTLSQTGWREAAASFEITPAVKGHFETRGRTLAFLPEKPLAPGKIYTVKLKQGWGIPDGSTLEKDYIVRFETEATKEARPVAIFPYPSVFESVPGKSPVIYLETSDDIVGTDMKIKAYALERESFKQALKIFEDVPSWAYASRNNLTGMDALAKNESFSASLKIERSESNWRSYVRMPDTIGQGQYLIKMESDRGETSWALMQRTSVSAYATADRENILVWVVDGVNARISAGTEVTYGGAKFRTDNQGLVRIPTPNAWRENADGKDEVKTEPAWIEIGDNAGWLLLSVKYDKPMWRFMGGAGQVADLNYWSYLFPDRPLYRTRDTIQFFGLMQDRKDGRGAGSVTVELRAAEYMLDFGTYDTKVYARRELQTDDQGFIQGDLSWPGSLKPGYYQLAIMRDGSVASSRTIEVRDTAKPAYRISVMPDVTDIYAGSKARGTVQIAFYDGTPLPKAKITMTASGGFGDNRTMEIMTDDSGSAVYEFETVKPACDLTGDYPICGARETLSIEARPVVGEEGEIVAYARVGVWRGHMYLTTEADSQDNGEASVKARVREVYLDRANGTEEDSVLGEGKAGVLVRSKAYEVHWDKVQTGTSFDPIEQKTVPQYRYDRRLVDAGTFEAKTGADGVATVKFPMQDGISYQVLTSVVEGNGVTHASITYVSKDNYERSGNDALSLEPVNASDSKNSYRIGEEISLALMRGGQRLTSGNGVFMFLRASRGVRSAVTSADPAYRFAFADTDVPNVTVYGIVLTGNGFEEAQYQVSLDTEDRNLKVTLTPDKASYAPGEKVTIRAKVESKDGQSVGGARVAITATDEALLSLTNLEINETPLESIYHWVPDGILTTKMTNVNQADFYGGGGAEMGGGERGMVVRGNFKDQATYQIVQTGGDGIAVAEFTAPDNITSWRTLASVVTSDRRAGTAKLSVPVTKQLFVDAVMPSDALVVDKPVIKLRAFGSVLKADGDVKYSVSIPTLGIVSQEIQGKTGKPVYVALDKLVVGTHKATVRVTSGNDTDAIEKAIRIVPSHATRDERIAVELAPGSVLPDVGLAPQVDVVISSKSRTTLRSRIESLAQPWSARLESQVAGAMMRTLAKDLFGNTIDAQEPSFARYQREQGGLAILPYASEDATLSTKISAAAPDLFDRSELANYFWTVTDDPKTTREESIQAISGLAALGQPVVDRLHEVAALADLNWREKLALIRGLDAIGEREAARQLLDSMLTGAEEQDGKMNVEAGESKADTIEATAEAAALAAELAHPSATMLMAYVDANWSEVVMTDLDRAMYLERIAPTLPNVDVEVTYMVGQEQKTIDLKENPSVILTLTADEVSSFRVLSVNGPAEASFVRQVTGNPPADPTLYIDRDYRFEGKTFSVLHEGDVVGISLSPRWYDKSPDGCYIVRDRLPATLAPLVSVTYGTYAPNKVSPFDVQDGEVTFVTCKQDKPEPIYYTARVVSLGTYQAEGTLMQSMDSPSVATQSAARTVEVK